VNIVSAAVKVSIAIEPPVRFCVTVAGPLKLPAISILPAELERFTDGLAAVSVAVTNGMISPYSALMFALIPVVSVVH